MLSVSHVSYKVKAMHLSKKGKSLSQFFWQNHIVLYKINNKSHTYNKSQQDAIFLKFIFIKNPKCFRQIYCPSSGVSTLYTQQ
jgi:hypothetical protein